MDVWRRCARGAGEGMLAIEASGSGALPSAGRCSARGAGVLTVSAGRGLEVLAGPAAVEDVVDIVVKDSAGYVFQRTTSMWAYDSVEGVCLLEP